MGAPTARLLMISDGTTDDTTRSLFTTNGIVADTVLLDPTSLPIMR
jgi:hypothetical protein